MALARVRPIAIGAASAGWPTTSQYGCVNVLDYGAVGEGNADDTLAVQAAVNTCRSVYFPGGDYRVETITIPIGAAGANYFGDGHFASDTPGLARTIIRAYTADQTAVFLLAASANNITFSDMLICGSVEAGGNAICGVDGTLGTNLTMYNCDVTFCKEFGAKTGSLANLHRVFFENNLAVGLQLGGDSMLSDSALGSGVVYLGTVPLWLCVGGNVVSNVNVYGGTECCIKIEALVPAAGTVENISIVNAYVGEVISAASMPVIKIQGSAGFKARWIHISNSSIFNSQAAANKINGGVLLDYAEDVQLSNVWHYGNGQSATATCYTDYFVKSTNTSVLKIADCVTRGVNKNPIVLGAGMSNVSITDNQFLDWALDADALPADYAAILALNSSLRVLVDGNQFTIEGAETDHYPAHVSDGAQVMFGHNSTYPVGMGPAVAVAGAIDGTWKAF